MEDRAGLHRVTVSLDTLRRDRVIGLTRVNQIRELVIVDGNNPARPSS